MTIEDKIDAILCYYNQKKRIKNYEDNIARIYEQITDLYAKAKTIKDLKDKLEKNIKTEMYGHYDEYIVIDPDTKQSSIGSRKIEEGLFEPVFKYVAGNKSAKSAVDMLLSDMHFKYDTEIDIDVNKLFDTDCSAEIIMENLIIDDSYLDHDDEPDEVDNDE